MSSSRSLLLSLLLVLSLLSPSLLPLVHSQVLTFTPRTASAPWNPRSESNIEWFPYPMTATLVSGATVTWPGRLMVLQGNGEGTVAARSNDIWVSPDQGVTWQLVAGRTVANVQARGGRVNTSFTPVLSRPATGIDNRHFIYRIGGSQVNGTKEASSWMSYDGGQSWMDQATRPGATKFAPGRDRTNIVVDESDNVYLISGCSAGSTVHTPTVWMSPSQGFTWQQLPNVPFTARGTAVAFSHRSRRLNREVFSYVTGWDGVALHNDMWVSSDLARTWHPMPLPPFIPRDSANGEVTRDGVIILVGGQSTQNGVQIALNDVWISMDGGWQWGQCLEDAVFSDRRDMLTMLDDNGYLYVAGGTDWYATPRTWFNDGNTPHPTTNCSVSSSPAPSSLIVAASSSPSSSYLGHACSSPLCSLLCLLCPVWRSSFSFNDNAAVAAACNVHVPACGTGLTCWPGLNQTSHYPNGSVTCPAIRACAGLPEVKLMFSTQATAAPWSQRWSANAELFPKAFSYTPSTGGAARTMPANSLIMQGGTNNGGTIGNDVWASSDFGRSWELIAGIAGTVRAGGTAATTSYSPNLRETTGIVDEVAGVIYRVGGYLDVGTASRNDVWRSTNAITWTRMAATNLPPRYSPNVVVDAKGKLYVIGGASEGTVAMRDVWVSTNNGASFTQPTTAPPFMTGGRGRTKGLLLSRRSLVLGKDILWVGLGYNNVAQFNDVWASSDDAATWVVVTAMAPFPRRDAAGAEVTASGLLVVTGGQTTGEVLNDVWVSADGGYTWGLCENDAVWADRREVTTVFDATETLYVMGGRSATQGRLFNDVFRSNISFSNLRQVQSACNIAIPACGPGLTCWPGAGDTRFTPSGGVTCPALEQCQRGILPSTAAVRRVSSSSSTARRVTPVDDPCLDWPVTDPTCDNYEWPATASAGGSAGSVPTWLIIGLAVVGVLLVAGVVWYYCRSVHTQQPKQGGDSLLLSDPLATS